MVTIIVINIASLSFLFELILFYFLFYYFLLILSWDHLGVHLSSPRDV